MIRQGEDIERFECELRRVDRKGMDDLLKYIRKSDFYTAPASTRFHLSCEGGLLQHSLNVLDALRGILIPVGDHWEYRAAGRTVCTVTGENIIIAALLHDICKTYYYAVSMRNAKNEETGQWEKVPYYTVSNKMPLGHGPKSAMIIKEYIKLENVEMYAIWHHMGFSSKVDEKELGEAIERYPFIWALHTADMMATHMMEQTDGNKELFAYPMSLAPPDIPDLLADDPDDAAP